MKNSTKLIIGLGIFAAATAAVTIAVVRELKAIRNLTINIDTLPDEDEELEELIEDTDVEEATVTEEIAEEEPAAEEAAEQEAVTD